MFLRMRHEETISYRREKSSYHKYYNPLFL